MSSKNGSPRAVTNAFRWNTSRDGAISEPSETDGWPIDQPAIKLTTGHSAAMANPIQSIECHRISWLRSSGSVAGMARFDGPRPTDTVTFNRMFSAAHDTVGRKDSVLGHLTSVIYGNSFAIWRLFACLKQFPRQRNRPQLHEEMNTNFYDR